MPHKVSSILVGGKQCKPTEHSDTLSAFGLIDKCPPQDAAALKSVGGIFVWSVFMVKKELFTGWVNIALFSTVIKK